MGKLRLTLKHLDYLVYNEPPSKRITKTEGTGVASGKQRGTRVQCALACIYIQKWDSQCQKSQVTNSGA